MYTLNLSEAIELLNVVSDFNFEATEKRPTITIYDNQNEGFVICVKASLVSEEYRIYLERVVKSRNLWMRDYEGFLMIKS